MTSFAARSGRFVLWLLVITMVLLAIAVTALRISLPKLNHFQAEISQWVEEIAGVPFEIGDVKGYWRNTRPSLSLKQLSVQGSEQNSVTLDIEEVQLEFDLLHSLLTLEPQVALLNVKGIHLNIRHIKLFPGASQLPNKNDNKLTQTVQENWILKQIERLLLRQLKDFTLLDFKVSYQSFDGKYRTLDIEQLKWRNRANHHKVEGVVSSGDSHINSLAIKADFIDHGSFRNLSGDFYVQAEKIEIVPWLAKSWAKETEVESGHISFNSWFTIKNNFPVDAYIELLPSELVWNKNRQHRLQIEEGVFKLTPGKENTLKVIGHSLNITSDDTQWPDTDLTFYYGSDKWVFNASQLDIGALRPLADLIPRPIESSKWLDRLAPTGYLEDIRISHSFKDDASFYSANLIKAGVKQWQLIPEVHQMSATISGNSSKLLAQIRLIDDVLPYGDVFQAPLNIKRGEIDIVWELDEQGWRLWADHVTAVTQDVQLQGAFKLDFPNQQAPFLSLYATAELYNAGEAWRYLPTRALGQELTDYLSSAIQGGKSDDVAIVWHGALDQFPYQQNNGVFQAKVGLKEGKFSFDTRWPAITDLQLDLLFENQSMYLDSRFARLMDVKAERVTGQIAHLGSEGAVEITAKAVAKGDAVRDYMMATPLVDSVGAALTTIKVAGNVASEFQLKIPFDSESASRVWGYADLPDNAIKIATPAIELSNAKGRIWFDNDVVHASGLAAKLLQQPISLDFKGENLDSSYDVNIAVLGDWGVKPLAPYLGEFWAKRVQGHAPWSMEIDIQLDDVGFTYQMDTQANLELVSSQFPAPFEKALGDKSKLQVQASGNQQNISARLQLPDVKYQAEIDISAAQPVLTATRLLFGKGGFKVTPIVGHDIAVRMSEFNLDDWLSFRAQKNTADESASSSHNINILAFPKPQRVTITTDTLSFASLDWHNVNFRARKKNQLWLLDVEGAEIKGQANYLEPHDLTVDLERLHIYLPALDKEHGDEPVFQAEEEAPLISHFDRQFHHLVPNLLLDIDDFWLQGYKVGVVNVDLQKQGNRLNWRNIDINSGANHINAKGWWELTENDSHSSVSMLMTGDNNTELMDRFGISSGIQKAPFEINLELSWQGAPWSMKIETLDGDVSLKFGKGIISDVSGAAKLLGMFSLDTIIRRMQLDFSNVFDNGIAFSHITGTGKINKGIFSTDDIAMDAPAGDMTIHGTANLNTNQVDAQVEFVPDLTSGIPVLTAFAVAPQSALMVFAVSTVISPVIDVFTKIQYRIVGPLDSPEVKELSRSKESYQVPEPDKKSD